jgi:tape measure domain-containing protein
VSVVANVAINVDSSGAVSKLRQVQTQAQSTEKAFGNVAAAVGKLAVAFGAIQAAKFVFAKTAELESQTRSLQVLTGSAEKAGQIIKELQQLGAVTPFTSTELIDSAKRLQAFGVEADKVVETTRRLADASGATGAELSGLVTAYGQVQAKGRLQGEELLQFQERGIALQEELRKMYGMTGEEFQKALSKGQVSAKAVEVALVNLTSAGGKYANGAIAQSDTLQGRLSTLQDGIDGLARGIGTALSPAIKAVLNEAIFAVNVINNLIATGARAKSFGLGDSQRKQILNQAQTEAQQIVEGRRIEDPFERNRQFQELAGQRERDLIESYGYRTGQVKPAATAPQMATQVPGLLGATVAGGGGGRAAAGGGADEAKRAADEALRESQRVADVIRDQQFITKQKGIQTKFAQLIFEAEQNADPIRVRQLQTVEALVLAGNETARLLEEEKNNVAQLAIARTRQGEAEAIRQQGLQDVLKLQIEQQKSFDEIIAGLELELALKSATTEQAREQLRLEAEIAKIRGDKSLTPEQQDEIARRKTELAKPKEESQKIEERLGKVKDELKELTSLSYQVTQAAEAIGSAFQQAFMGLVSGAMTGREALASFFSSVADHFLDMASKMIAKMIEMFILQTVLGIIGGAAGSGGGGGNAAAKMGSSPNVAAYAPLPRGYAEGGFVTGPTNAIIGEGGESEYVIPASKMSAAMQRYGSGARGEGVLAGSGGGTEGGATAAAGPMVVDVRYSVERINDVEYVTASQFQAGMQQAAQQGATQGEQRTLRKLQMSNSTRRRIGV